jgi:NAD(P)-dependent dehydrogenase (short-subunit alcohol dehydrogenase family)
MPVAIITGASQGFGQALASDLAQDGWDLVIDARHADPLQASAKRLAQSGRDVRAIAGDVADADHRDALVDAAHSLGRLDLVVNNASTLGPSPLPPLERYPLDELERVFAVNAVAPLALVQAALALLRESDGTVVSITSDAATEAYEGWGGYGASKAALEQLTNVLAAEHPALHIYSFDPGDLRTQMHQDAFPGEDISDRPEPETAVPALRRLLHEHRPSGRYRAADLGEETS